MSFIKDLTTDNTSLRLIKPDPDRDATISLKWLEGSTGRETLLSMGVPASSIKETTIEDERARVKDFIDRKDQLNWMISFEQNIIGSVWVDLVKNNNISAPSVHIMIGDPEARGKGIGLAVVRAVVEFLMDVKNYNVVYSRHLIDNYAISKIFNKLCFEPDGLEYKDEDNLTWQNIKLYKTKYRIN